LVGWVLSNIKSRHTCESRYPEFGNIEKRIKVFGACHWKGGQDNWPSYI